MYPVKSSHQFFVLSLQASIFGKYIQYVISTKDKQRWSKFLWPTAFKSLHAYFKKHPDLDPKRFSMEFYLHQTLSFDKAIQIFKIHHQIPIATFNRKDQCFILTPFARIFALDSNQTHTFINFTFHLKYVFAMFLLKMSKKF